MADRIIALIAGDSGAGKSFFIGNLPNALIFDTDVGGGLSYLDGRIHKNQSERIEVGSYPEVLNELKARDRAGELDKRFTVAIDHATALQQEANLRYNPSGESDFGRANERATREWRAIREFCRRKDFNLIVTGHMKGKWERSAGTDPQQTGNQIDGAKNMEGDVHVVLHLRRMDSKKYPSYALVQKWRRDPDDPRGLVPAMFPFTVEDFVKIDGTNALRREREPIKLATPEQIEEIGRLLEVAKIPQEDIDKLWKKNNAEGWAELPAEIMAKAIDKAKVRMKEAMNGQHTQKEKAHA